MSSLEKDLYLAVQDDDLARFRNVLSQMANGNLGRNVWNHGEAPLHHAAFLGRNKMVTTIEEYGVNIDSLVRGYTALHYAVLGRKLTTVQLLLDLGADFVRTAVYKDRSLMSNCRLSGKPLDWARQLELVAICNLLEGQRNPAPLTLQDIPRKVNMEKELRDALLVQEKMRAKNMEMSIVDERMKQLVEQGRVLGLEKEAMAAEVATLQRQTEFRTKRQIGQLRRKLEDLNTLASSIRDMVLPDNDDKNCPICFEIPREAYSCHQCENWVCNGCRIRLVRCPSCSQDFLANPPKRNRGIKRVLGI